MSLFQPKPGRANWTFDTYGANPLSTLGTTLTPGVVNVDSAWVQIAAAGAITEAVVGFQIYLHGMAAHGAANQQVLLDIGIDPAGGTSYTEIVSDLLASQLTTLTDGGKTFFFPLSIPAGATVAIRARGVSATAALFRVAAKFYGQVGGLPILPVGSIAETLGAVPATSTGTPFTPGNAADGAWVLLGTTVNPLWWWNLCASASNTVITAERCYIDLAYGDATTKIVMKRLMMLGNTAEYHADILHANINPYDCFHPVPAGMNIYIRGRAENAPDTGYVGLAIGIGG